ncbi:ankyrin repeat protein [Flavobacterium sp. 90]|uniref:ankyrin repeat domain-containing protein n=1 Tax=unclassified Flavobacterium TaxID=196869 RepID=UPI000EB1CC1A|nr:MULTISPECIES: ankyrin repeat domain-containing protein [unclassified Flavobacterium]RKR11623.1 ankyrin repeat protein [Flavobacterium sp. 81]TCK55402.1 ankyrin repeat protein [Flavobacterium sp. 90]
MQKSKLVCLLLLQIIVLSCKKSENENVIKTASTQSAKGNQDQNYIKKAIELNQADFVHYIDTTKNINAFYKFDESNSYTILGYCCKFGRYDFVKKLISKKADIALGQEDEDYQYDALYVAIENQNEKIVDLLLENKANVNSIYTEGGLTPLSFACQFSNFHIVEALINHNADIKGKYNPQTEMASIPIIEAVKSKNKEAVKLLVEKGADVNQVDLEETSALSYAKANDPEIYNLLNQLSDKAKSSAPIAEKFQGEFEVSTKGELTNEGTGSTTYHFTITTNGIVLKSEAFGGDFLCEGNYKGVEKEGVLELYYNENDDRCKQSKPNYRIKKDGEKYFIRGVGGEGTYNEWVKIDKK